MIRARRSEGRDMLFVRQAADVRVKIHQRPVGLYRENKQRIVLREASLIHPAVHVGQVRRQRARVGHDLLALLWREAAAVHPSHGTPRAARRHCRFCASARLDTWKKQQIPGQPQENLLAARTAIDRS